MPELNDSTYIIILGILFGISELLSLVPSIKANGIFQLIYRFLKFLVPSSKKKEV